MWKILKGLSKGNHSLLNDSHPDQGGVCWDSCPLLVLVFMFNDKFFRLKQRTMSGDPGLHGVSVDFRTRRHSTVGGTFMFGLLSPSPPALNLSQHQGLIQ